MKKSPAITRLATIILGLSLGALSFAQPPPGGGPGGPGGPFPGGPRGPVPGVPGVPIPRVPIPIVPIPGRPPIPPPDEGSSLVAQVQRKLKRLGLYEGPVDGDLGRGTRGAIRAFQGEHELAVTGNLDRPTLRALGL